jgi:hypothetical protein
VHEALPIEGLDEPMEIVRVTMSLLWLSRY